MALEISSNPFSLKCLHCEHTVQHYKCILLNYKEMQERYTQLVHSTDLRIQELSKIALLIM